MSRLFSRFCIVVLSLGLAACEETVVPPEGLDQVTADGTLLTTVSAPAQIDRMDSAAVSLSLESQFGDTGGLDMIFAMDSSGSVGSSGWQQQRQFVATLLTQLLPQPPDPRTRAGIVQFSNQAQVRHNLTDNQAIAALRNTVLNLNFLSGFTHTRDATQAALDTFAAQSDPERGKLLVLITDGRPLSAPIPGEDLTFAEREALQSPCPLAPELDTAGITVFLITVGNFNTDLLTCLIDDPDEQIASVGNFQVLDSIVAQVDTFISPVIEGNLITATLGPAFEVIDGPVPGEVVIPPGATVDPSLPSYDPATRELRWELAQVNRTRRTIDLVLAPLQSTDPLCDVHTALSDLQLIHTNPESGLPETDLAPGIAIELVGCEMPVVASQVLGTLGANGWYVSDVAVSWQIDSVAPLTATTGCDPTLIDSDTAGRDLTCTAASAEGSDSETVTVRRDVTPPTVVFAGNQDVYQPGETVNITCLAEDATSGIADAFCPSLNAPALDLPPGTQSLNAIVSDNAGNVTQASISFVIIADDTPPVITPVLSGELGDNGWYVSDVQIEWIVEDPQTPVSIDAGCSAQTLSSDSTGTSYACSASSEGGSATRTVVVRRDLTPPTVSCSNNAGSYDIADDIDIACSASDATSGLAEQVCAAVQGPGWGFGIGTHGQGGCATDNAGNVNADSVMFEVGVSRDGLIEMVRRWSVGPDGERAREVLTELLLDDDFAGFVDAVTDFAGGALSDTHAQRLIGFVQLM